MERRHAIRGTIDLPLNTLNFEESPALIGTDQMKRKRFTGEQIIGILHEQKAGAKAADLGRRYSESTLYDWKARFGSMDVSEAKRLKGLEEANAGPNKFLADQMLEAAALRVLLSKNVWSAPSVQGSRSF